MSVNSEFVAQAVVHWLEFERICGRENLISESYLKHPIGLCLNARSKNPVEAEASHPVLAASGKPGRDKQVDFVIRTRNKSTITDSFETKWITDKRDFKQELFNDLARLEMIHAPNHDNGRWLLLAGKYSLLKSRVFDAEGNLGGGKNRVRIFDSILLQTIQKKQHVGIEVSGGPINKLWRNTASALGVDLPKSLSTKLTASFPSAPQADQICCFIWMVFRSANRATFKF